ncbi:MAG: hypothetical protein IT225_06845 [Flavobacteriales bacterium]|mgnify:CR=1 FL=1|jgi:hypothetical protein|nr:hypothetical protein [Flavobacteriales bacterium]
MDGTRFLPDESGSTERPDLIQVLGSITFVNTGLFMALYSLMFLSMLVLRQMPVDEFVASISDSAALYLPKENLGEMESIARLLHAHGVLLMAIYLARTVLRFIGALGMWRGRRSGFHLYAAAQFVGLFAPHIVLPWSMLGVFGPLLTVAVTAMYGSQLKRMQ